MYSIYNNKAFVVTGQNVQSVLAEGSSHKQCIGYRKHCGIQFQQSRGSGSKVIFQRYLITSATAMRARTPF